jgi:hypothetical protein
MIQQQMMKETRDQNKTQPVELVERSGHGPK